MRFGVKCRLAGEYEWTPMTEFKFPNKPAIDGKTVAGLRFFLWACVAVLLGLGAFGVFGPASPDRGTLVALGDLGFFLVFAALGVAYFYGRKIGIAQQRQEASFVLTDKELILKREGWPDSQFKLASISVLNENSRGLQVSEGGEYPLWMSVPRELENYALLRAELAKHQAITRERPSTRTKRILGICAGLGIPLVLVAAFYSKRPRAILVAFGCYLIWFIASSFYMATQRRG